MKPIVAIIGRPNVGKSTLFNRITRTKKALVDDFPGVTRDRHYGDARWDDRSFSLVDTGGFTDDPQDAFSPRIRDQVLTAIQDADAVILLMDGKQGVSPFDTDMAGIVRNVAKPVFFVVNKIDGGEQEDRLYEFYQLGAETLYPVSAEHGYGISDLLDTLVDALPRRKAESEPENEAIRIAVVGRPNAGKSSLINRILGKDRLLVSDVPGTTRDAVDTLCRVDGRPYLLIDTAGIRRKGKVSHKLEKFSIIKSLKSLERCDVALIVIDAEEGVCDQDVTIAGYAQDRGCGCIFLVNKWDLVDRSDKTAKKFNQDLRMAARFLHFAPMLTISALTGTRVTKIFGKVEAVYNQYTTRLSTGQINRIFERAMAKTQPSLHKGRRLKFYYSTQVSTRPPTFVSFVNYPDAVHFSYRRYLINQIREQAGLDKTPIRLFFRPRSGRKRYKG